MIAVLRRIFFILKSRNAAASSYKLSFWKCLSLKMLQFFNSHIMIQIEDYSFCRYCVDEEANQQNPKLWSKIIFDWSQQVYSLNCIGFRKGDYYQKQFCLKKQETINGIYSALIWIRKPFYISHEIIYVGQTRQRKKFPERLEFVIFTESLAHNSKLCII